METKPNPQDEFSKTETLIEKLFCIVLALSGLCALYSLIWANWPVFKVSLTIFVTVIIGVAFGYFMANYFERVFKNRK